MAELPVTSDDDSPEFPLGFDTGVAHPARVYDYWLGGKDNFAADREAAEQVLAARAGDPARHPGQPGVPGPGGALPGPRARHPPVPGHRHRHPASRTTARGRPGDRPGRPGRLRRQRPDRAGPRPGAAGQHAGGQDRLRATRTCATGRRSSARPRKTLDFASRSRCCWSACCTWSATTEDPYRIVAELMGALPPGSYLVLTHPASDISAARPRRSAATTAGRHAADAAQPGRGRRGPRRPGARAAGPGPVHQLAARAAGRRAAGHGLGLRRRRAQAISRPVLLPHPVRGSRRHASQAGRDCGWRAQSKPLPFGVVISGHPRPAAARPPSRGRRGGLKGLNGQGSLARRPARRQKGHSSRTVGERGGCCRQDSGSLTRP